MKKLILVLAATVICGAGLFTSCNKDDQKNIQHQWITDYAEEGTDPVSSSAYNRVVEVYDFFDDGTGYYECYALNGNTLVYAEYVRGENGDLHYTVNGDKVTVTLDDESEPAWTLTYADNTLTDPEGCLFHHSTDEQKAQLLQWYEQWHGGNYR